MPLYEYMCRTCMTRTETTEHAQTLGPCDCGGELRRKFSFNNKPMFQDHFNNAVNNYVRSEQDFKDQLKQGGEDYFKRTGIETNPQPIDYGDKQALGVTEEGMDATNRERRKRGLPTVKV